MVIDYGLAKPTKCICEQEGSACRAKEEACREILLEIEKNNVRAGDDAYDYFNAKNLVHYEARE